MGTNYRYKMIMDPVHGDIGLTELETKLINTPTFQRLRRIKQLGFATYVYPNASYSRFVHSLGVLHIASRVAQKFYDEDSIEEDAVCKLRLAALLHDVGHYPYSHLMEYIECEEAADVTLVKRSGTPQPSTKSRAYPDHEQVGKWIITDRKDISNLLRTHDIDPAEIAALIEGEHPKIPNILHKSLDVDRLDYLVRDSHNTGLPYGHVDLDYILNNLHITSDQEIGVHEKARLSVEHLLLGRYYSFKAIYLHKTVFGFEEMVRRAIQLLIENDHIASTKTEIEKMVKSSDDSFLRFHDGLLDRKFEKHKDDVNCDLAKWCRAITERRPAKLVYEIVDLYPRTNGNPTQDYTKFKTFLRFDLKNAAASANIPFENLFWREPKDVRLEVANPFVSLSQIKDPQATEQRELVQLITARQQVINLVEDTRSFIHHLSQLQTVSIRLYGLDLTETQIAKLREHIIQRLEEI